MSWSFILPTDEEGAYETMIDGVWYAWDECDRVFVQDPNHPNARDDGYRYIGHLEYDDSIDHPETQIRVFLEKIGIKND